MKPKIVKKDLASLLDQYKTNSVVFDIVNESSVSTIHRIDPFLIDDCPLFARIKLHPEVINKYIQSYKENRVAQPIYIQRINNKYQLLIGRRRLMAAKMVKMDVPAVVIAFEKEFDVLLFQLADILERKNQDYLEIALLLNELKNNYGFTQNELATLTSLSRSQVANILRLLGLPNFILEELTFERISFGHAKILVTRNKKEQQQLLNLVLKEQLSVHELEKLVYLKA